MNRFISVLTILILVGGCARTQQYASLPPAVRPPATRASVAETLGIKSSPSPTQAQAQEATPTVAASTTKPDPQTVLQQVTTVAHVAQGSSAAEPEITPPEAAQPLPEPELPEPEVLPLPEFEGSPLAGNLPLDDVIQSVYNSYPMLEAAIYSRNIANGEQIAAMGELDLKFKAASENGPTGFYQTYRQSVGLIQPLYQGGEVFAGYRIGRGDFQPWYLERQTNDGGEFKAGVGIPLLRDRSIDARRAQIWKSNYGRQIAEPEIQAQLISFVQDASYAYWDWVAAGTSYRIVERVLNLADERTERIRSQVEKGLLDPPELTDNLRLVSERRAKLAEATQKLQQYSIKLSLYYRDANGRPLIPTVDHLPDFPDPTPLSPDALSSDIQIALAQRPEISLLTLLQQQLQVDYAEARNQSLPSVDAVLSASQDVGTPTSKKNDKGQFELDASVFVDVPLQRRKAIGKMEAVAGKLSQLYAKRRLTEDKISTEIQTAHASIRAAYEQVLQTNQAVTYAEELAQRERRNFELGASDLLKVTLREQYAAESALKAVEAHLLYHKAQADYRAALALDRLP